MITGRNYRPGQICPVSGQWGLTDGRGFRVGRTERTVVKGEPFPPTPLPGQMYYLADQTRYR